MVQTIKFMPIRENNVKQCDACDHSYPSFAKPIDTSHRVVCHGTLSTAESSCEEYKQHKQGGIYYP